MVVRFDFMIRMVPLLMVRSNSISLFMPIFSSKILSEALKALV